MNDKNSDSKISRRKVLGTTGSAFAYASIGTSSAQGKKYQGAEHPHTTPYDVSVTNNGDQKHKLTFTLTNPESGEVEYEHQVVLPGLNDTARGKAQSVKKRLNIKVPTGIAYSAKLESDSGASETSEWYIPEEGTDFISLAASISPEEEITIHDWIV